MTLLLAPILQRFAEQFPIPTMALSRVIVLKVA